MSKIGEIALIFISFADQMKLYHWSTTSYARHKASDDLVDKIRDKTDSFIEMMQGGIGQRLRMPKNNSIAMELHSDESIVILMKGFREWLANTLPQYLRESDTDLLNIRDEIVGDVDKALYLFTFK